MTDATPPKDSTQEADRCGIRFEELRKGRCKFPLGGFDDPPEWFCGKPSSVGQVYCQKCQQKAYNRSFTRR